MYTISKEFRFEAAHCLNLSYKSKCNNSHGHSYRVELILSAKDLNENGMVVDYNHLKDFGDYIENYLDHRNLNDILQCSTTAENIAKYLYLIAWKLWSHLQITVKVSETAKTWASYSEDGQ